MEFQKLVRDIDYLTHIHISYTYLRRKKAVENCEKAITDAKTYIEKCHKEIESNKTETETLEAECAQMQENIDAETGGGLAELETELAAKSKAEAVANGAKKSATSELDTEKRKLKALQKSIATDTDALKTKEDRMKNVGGLFQSLKEADEADSKAFAEAQKRVQAVSTGLDTDEDGQASSLQEQLISK